MSGTNKSSYTSLICKINQPKELEQQENMGAPTRTSEQR
jgi:hypothetical protein